MRHFRPVLVILAIVLILVACTGEEEATIEPTPTFESAEVPEGTTPFDTMDFEVDPDLVDVTWEWYQRTTTEGTEVLLEVPNPEDYTLFFNLDQTFSAQLDCNNGTGDYVTDGNGNIFMQLGPMTAAACSPESLSDEMVQLFGPAQSYVYEGDGDTVIFKFAAGGPWDYYRKSD